MKLNLLFDSDNVLSGYTNVDPYADEKDKRKIKGDVDNLDYLCEEAECQHIIAVNVLDHFSSKDVDHILEHWISKLRHKGIITIGGVDLVEISKAINNNYIDLIQANIMLFGLQSEVWQTKKACLTSSSIIIALQNCGLRIIKNRINNYQYSIEGERP